MWNLRVVRVYFQQDKQKKRGEKHRTQCLLLALVLHSISIVELWRECQGTPHYFAKVLNLDEVHMKKLC